MSRITINIENLFDAEPQRQYIKSLKNKNPDLIETAIGKLSVNQFVGIINAAMRKASLTADVLDENEKEDIFCENAEKHLTRAISDIKELKSIIPKNSLIINSKLANSLSNFEPNIETTLSVGKRGKQPIKIAAMLSYDDDRININSGLQKFTSYDKIVNDTICSLFEAGNELFTPEMVYRAMNGMFSTETVSDKAIQAITASINKIMDTKITIDYTEQVNATCGPEIEKATVSERLLSLKEVTVTSGGITKSAYAFNSSPILYEYSKKFKQIISFPSNLLYTQMRSTGGSIIVKTYLLKRIELMKNKNNGIVNNKIRYDAIYKELDISDNKKAKYDARTMTLRLLDNYRGRGYIKGYTEIKNGKALLGVEILL